MQKEGGKAKIKVVQDTEVQTTYMYLWSFKLTFVIVKKKHILWKHWQLLKSNSEFT